MRKRVKPERITAEWLKSIRACEEEVERFDKLFPRGLAVTIQNCVRALDAGFREEIKWLARKVLPREDYAIFYDEFVMGCTNYGTAYTMLNLRRKRKEIGLRKFQKARKEIAHESDVAEARAFVKAWNSGWNRREKRRSR